MIRDGPVSRAQHGDREKMLRRASFEKELREGRIVIGIIFEGLHELRHIDHQLFVAEALQAPTGKRTNLAKRGSNSIIVAKDVYVRIA